MNEGSIRDSVKIYVVHHNKLIDRKLLISERLKDESIVVDWVELFTPEEIKSNYEIYVKDNTFHDIIINHPYGRYKNFSKKITLSELSLFLKHKFCFEQQIKNNEEFMLILEDDCVIPKNFNQVLINNLNEFIKKNGDILILGECENFKPLGKNGEYIHYDSKNKTRCTHAILYNIESTKKIIKYMNTVNLPIDFKLNEIMELEKFNVFWTIDGLHQNKNYTSSINK